MPKTYLARSFVSPSLPPFFGWLMEVVDKRGFFPTITTLFNRPSWPLFLLLLTAVAVFTHHYAVDDVGPSLDQDHELPSSQYPANSCSGLYRATSPARKLIKSIVDFGGVGDGSTLNTGAFRRAVDHLKANARGGGSQLNVPEGRWLTGSFNLTSHFTLYLERGAVILGSQDAREWPIIEALPSYGRGRERGGGRHISLIHGHGLQDVVITGTLLSSSSSIASS